MAQQNSQDSRIAVHQTMPQHFHMICSKLHSGNTMEYHPSIVSALNHAYTGQPTNNFAHVDQISLMITVKKIIDSHEFSWIPK